MASIDVDFDAVDYIDEISTKELEEELARRYAGKMGSTNISTDDVLFENLYYALRDGDVEAIIKAANPLLEGNLGKQV
jgi:hypothetical protein